MTVRGSFKEVLVPRGKPYKQKAGQKRTETKSKVKMPEKKRPPKRRVFV